MSGRPAPPKPWERARPGGASGGSPADGLPKPWESPSGTGGGNTIVPTSTALATTTGNAQVGTPGSQQPPRPWERTGGTMATTSGAGYASPYNTANTYGRPGYGGYGGSYGGIGSYGGYGGALSSPYGGMGGMYGNSMYGGGMYGGGMYGGGMYGRPMMGGFGMNPYGAGPMGWDPNDPNGPPAPPSAWQAMLGGISGIVHFFGRLSFLVDENAHAVHFFISALLQLLDRFGSLYGELARFVLRLLGFRPKDSGGAKQGQPAGQQQQQQHGPPGAPFDSVWGNRNPH